MVKLFSKYSNQCDHGTARLFSFF